MLPLLATTVTAESGDGAANAIAGAFGYITSINWAAPTWDLFIVLFFLVTVFLYGMSLGRDRIIIILVSIYMSLAVISNAPIEGVFGGAEIQVGKYFAFQVSAFLGLFVLLFFMLSRSALSKTFSKLHSGSWFQVLLFSVFHVGMLVSITLSFLPAEAVDHLAPLTRQVFAGETMKFLWIVAPIASMIVLKSDDR
jgi:hypothetical protein